MALEALALALDPYPRAEGAALGDARFAPPGTQPLDEEALKPFAGLAELREKLAGKELPDEVHTQVERELKRRVVAGPERGQVVDESR